MNIYDYINRISEEGFSISANELDDFIAKLIKEPSLKVPDNKKNDLYDLLDRILLHKKFNKETKTRIENIQSALIQNPISGPLS